MAFLRFNRDKRGYEHFYLVEATTNRRGKTRARVLYWFRTPPNVKVGRAPFDDDVRRALEQQNPGVVFDWRKIVETPIPSADAERWRERRRLERAEKAARRAEATTSRRPAAEPDEVGEDVDAGEAPDLIEPPALAVLGDLTEPEEFVAAAVDVEDEAFDDHPDAPQDDDRPDAPPEAAIAATTGAPPIAVDGAPATPNAMAESRSRRRRRRRRGRRPGDGPRPDAQMSAAPVPDTSEPPSAPAPDPVDHDDPAGE